MLGWHISVFRQSNGGVSPATVESETGTKLGVWQTDVDGLRWIDALVEAGKAVDLGGNGYPFYYTAPAEVLILQIMKGPPHANDVWVYEQHDILTEDWAGKTEIDESAVGMCRPDEWLLVEAWDES